MLGAIVGDIVGSRFEWHNIKSTQFDFFDPECFFTDDSVLTIALCSALLKAKESHDLEKEAIDAMLKFGRKYPDAGYGGRFMSWLLSQDPIPYNSFGNGSAMRVSGCGFAANSLEEALSTAKTVTAVTHNHPEGMKGALATTHAIYLARQGASQDEIKRLICAKYYDISFTLDKIRRHYTYDVTCQGSVPQALEAFFEAKDFEEAVRLAISIGGDSDTIAAITGSVAEAYFGIPKDIRDQALDFLDDNLRSSVLAFEEVYPPKIF